MAATDDGQRRVSTWTLVRVFGRSLLLQTGFNPRVMQGLGIAFALRPALKQLHPDGIVRDEAFRRHLTLFNTHPVFAAGVIGAMVRMEERVASGTATPQEVIAVRNAFATPLAAIGDSYFWDAVRPGCALLAALAAPWIGLWAVALFLLSYNAIHLAVRVWLFRMGYRDAEALIGPVKQQQFPVQTKRLRTAAAVLAGVVTAVLLSAMVGRPPTRADTVPFVLSLTALLLGVWLAPRRHPVVLALGALAFGLLSALLL